MLGYKLSYVQICQGHDTSIGLTKGLLIHFMYNAQLVSWYKALSFSIQSCFCDCTSTPVRKLHPGQLMRKLEGITAYLSITAM